MQPLFRNFFVMIVAAILLCACAVTPRVSSWDSPKRFTKSQVFNASLQAGAQVGMTNTASDRESGVTSFSKQIGKGTMTLNVNITEDKGIIKVRTTARYGGDLAISGLHEEVIQNFHVFLFRNLNITDKSERNIDIEQMR